MNRNFRTDRTEEPQDAAPSEAWLFAQALLGKPIPDPAAKAKQARAEREHLEWLAQISTTHAEQLRRLQSAEAEARHQRELLEWLAQISTQHAAELRRLKVEEYEAQEAQQRWEQYYQEYSATVTEWNEVDHPRQPKGAPDGGQWVGTGGGGGAGSEAAAVRSTPNQTTASDRDQTTAQLVALNGAPSSTWPTMGPASSWLPKIGSGVAAGAGAAAGIGAGAFLGGLRNASMGAYWARVPGTQAMPSIWVNELEKRVRAGTLSREDAIGIFNTAVLGAQAQGFQPTGTRMSLVHRSVVDFLGKAEAVYFARKKKAQGWATQPGGYQLSGGRVFPTKRNSGLDGYALRQEQEKFFERGLSEGKLPGQLRGQAQEAGSKRIGGLTQKDDHLVDAEAEAALQRAIQKTKR